MSEEIDEREKMIERSKTNADQEQSGTNSEKNPKLDVLETDPGPVHALLRIVKDYSVDNLYQCSDDILLKYADLALSWVCGKNFWNQMTTKTKERIGRFVTISDEAFAMVILEGNAEKWMFEFQNPTVDINKRPPSQFTKQLGSSKKGVGWNDKGYSRYTDLCFKCRSMRDKKAIASESSNSSVSYFGKLEGCIEKRNYERNPNNNLPSTYEEWIEHNRKIEELRQQRGSEKAFTDQMMMYMSMGKDINGVDAKAQKRTLNEASPEIKRSWINNKHARIDVKDEQDGNQDEPISMHKL